MAWKKFDPRESSAVPKQEALASINSHGVLYLNPSAAALLATRPGAFAELFYDAAKKRLGVQAVTESTPTSYTLTTVRGKDYRKVTVTRLLQAIGMEMTETQRYRVSWSAEHEMVVVDVRQPLSATAREKARRQPRKKRLRSSVPGVPPGEEPSEE
jgi:hypothetical protein